MYLLPKRRAAKGPRDMFAVVEGSAADVATNVQVIAAGTEEMPAVIGEISRNAQQAAEVAARATEAMGSGTTTMSQLGESSRRSATSSSRSPRSPSRPICWRSTPRSNPPGPDGSSDVARTIQGRSAIAGNAAARMISARQDLKDLQALGDQIGQVLERFPSPAGQYVAPDTSTVP